MRQCFYGDIADAINAGNTAPLIYSGWENTLVTTGTKMLEYMQDKASIEDVCKRYYNGNQQILCQRNNPKIDLFKEFGVNEEDVQYIRVLLHQTSVQNKEISVQLKTTVENDSQMYKLKLHTLWSPLKKDGYIEIIGYFGIVK